MITTHQSFLNEKGFAVYKEYLALKRHFTSTYDYFKYNGVVNGSFESFTARNDAYSFQRLSKHSHHKNLILANMVENPKIWIGELLEENANDVYLRWKRKTDAITKHIQDSIVVMNDDFQSNFIVTKNGQYPLLIDLYLQKKMSIESVAIIKKITVSQ